MIRFALGPFLLLLIIPGSIIQLSSILSVLFLSVTEFDVFKTLHAMPKPQNPVKYITVCKSPSSLGVKSILFLGKIPVDLELMLQSVRIDFRTFRGKVYEFQKSLLPSTS